MSHRACGGFEYICHLPQHVHSQNVGVRVCMQTPREFYSRPYLWNVRRTYILLSDLDQRNLPVFSGFFPQI